MLQYDVFISYARKDYVDPSGQINIRSIVYYIQQALQRAGLTYWIDEEGLHAGENFPVKIAHQIENSKVFLLVSTENSNNSAWVINEVAIAHHFNKPIIPFRYDASAYNKGLLIYIASLQYIDYQKDTNAIGNLVSAIKDAIKHSDESAEGISADSQSAKAKGGKKKVAILALISALVLILVLWGVKLYNKIIADHLPAVQNVYVAADEYFHKDKDCIVLAGKPGVVVLEEEATRIGKKPCPRCSGVILDNQCFVKGVLSYEYYKPFNDEHNEGVTYAYVGRNLKVQFYYLQLGMVAKLIDEVGNKTDLNYPDPFEMIAEGDDPFEGQYANFEYVLTQYDFNGDQVDEIVIASRVKDAFCVPVNVFVYDINAKRWWNVEAPETWGDMTVSLSVNRIKVMPNHDGYTYDWAFENGDFVDYGTY